LHQCQWPVPFVSVAGFAGGFAPFYLPIYLILLRQKDCFLRFSRTHQKHRQGLQAKLVASFARKCFFQVERQSVSPRLLCLLQDPLL
jgi:hypothetical protein